VENQSIQQLQCYLRY